MFPVSVSRSADVAVEDDNGYKVNEPPILITIN